MEWLRTPLIYVVMDLMLRKFQRLIVFLLLLTNNFNFAFIHSVTSGEAAPLHFVFDVCRFLNQSPPLSPCHYLIIMKKCVML